MGGKTATSTSQLSIPPEVMANYNAANAMALSAATKPFQPYSDQASAFVAPLTQTQMAAEQGINQAQGMYKPYYNAATQSLSAGQQAANPLQAMAAQGIGQAYGQGQQYLGGATQAAMGAMAPAQAYNQAATGQVQAGLGTAQQALAAGQPYLAGATAGVQNALTGAQPYQGLATQMGLAGAQAVDPTQLGAGQIGQYMSPYMQSVVAGTLAPLQQQQQEEQRALVGQQIASGAFGGEGGQAARANLARQQEMATAQTVSNLMQQGYGQALATAQQQQQLGLGAAQANRAALQQQAAQMAALGQQGYGQQMGAAQALAQLGQQGYQQQMGLSQALQGLGAQGYQQQMGHLPCWRPALSLA